MRTGELREGNAVTVFGHLEDVRDLGGLKFLVLRDIQGRIQVVVNKSRASSEMIILLDSLTRESVVRVSGIVKADPRAPGGFEIHPTSVEVVSKAESPLPIDVAGKTETNLDLRLDWRFLDLRRPEVSSIFRLQSKVGKAVREYFDQNGFIEIHTSKIVSQATEGGANVFSLMYFKRPAYLAQSPQFYKQMMIAAGFEKVWEIGPVYRAEPHHTPRHICEYVSIDLELGYIQSHEDVMRVVENLMTYVLRNVAQEAKDELEIHGKQLRIPALPFPRVTMEEAYSLLEERGVPVTRGSDLDPTGERELGQIISEKYGSDFVFLTEFPWSVAQFYHMRKPSDPAYTNRADLLYKGLEICTLAQREHRYDVLMSQAKEKGLNASDFRFYLDFFRYGVPPHGGGALGLERIVMQMLDLKNIRESTLLPRTPERLTP